MPTSDNPRITQSLRYLAQVKGFIDGVPRMARGKATVAAAEYYVKKLRFYPPYKFYGRAQAYPEAHTLNPEAWLYTNKKGQIKLFPPQPGYFSLKQFRHVMSLKSKYDFGYPHRTGKLQRGWKLESSGTKTRIVNESAGAPFVMGNKKQARQPKGVGWQRVQEIIEENKAGAIEAMKAEIMKENPTKTRRARKIL